MASTVTHPRRATVRRSLRRSIGMVVAGLVVSAGIGYAIANQPEVEATAAHPRVVQFDRSGQKSVAELNRMKAQDIQAARSQALVDHLTRQYLAEQEGPGPR